MMFNPCTKQEIQVSLEMHTLHRWQNRRWFIIAMMSIVTLLRTTDVHADEAVDRHFTLKVLPILMDKCAACHDENIGELEGEFHVLDRNGLLRGGESEEPGIVPGDAEAGTVMEAITWSGLEMPPKENDRLDDKQVDAIAQWIRDGAVWPDETIQERIRAEEASKTVTDAGVLVQTSGGTSDQWTNRRYQPDALWAWRPLADSAHHAMPPEEAVDHFIERQLSAGGLPAAGPASPAKLLRRLHYDLTGLPPTPEQITQFVAACDVDPTAARSEAVDRLLDSTAYGEHWARHWFDVTRYADTGGMANDYERSNMWRYRDYVIRSLNADKPYDEFIVEQLAGDELADQSVRDRVGGDEAAVARARKEGDYTPEEVEQLIATGFLRMGPWDNAMVMADEARQIYLDDLVNITGQAFLSTTMRCCKCHDHKFDPIPTRDYYRLYSAFSTTHMAERPAALLDCEDTSEFTEGKALVHRLLDYAVDEKGQLVDKREAAARKWFDEHDLPYKDDKARRNLPDEEKPPRHVGLNHVEQGQLKVREQDEWIWRRRLERYEPMVQSVYNAAAVKIPGNGARKLRMLAPSSKEAPEMFILQGGALTATGDRVQPGVLSAVPATVGVDPADPFLLPDSVDGRRLALARWIASPDNALAMRSIVNRVWQFHFGVGLAANSNNFGATGGKPSHPELLDFLARDFIEHGFRLKRLHRLIMMSDAFARTSTPTDPEAAATLDPNNRLLSYFPRRRLRAEELRDSLLASTGELESCSGGVPIMPEINMEVALQPRMIQFSLAPSYQPSPTPSLRNRRTVYAYQVRGLADPLTQLFDQPNSSESCELRESAAVTPQSMTLLNSDVMVDRSIAMATRLQSETNDIGNQVERAFELVLLRPPTSPERRRMMAYVREMETYHQSVTPDQTHYPTKIDRELVEEFSGKPFEYQEVLPVFENYVADAKPADVTPATRALADMALLLFNTNEFIYVD
ncbi:MAG: PSD1 and planctomycete cytochrome C domain-containing protein [Planctomycetota bacterium]